MSDSELQELQQRLFDVQQALEDSQRRLALAVEAADIGLWDWELGSRRVCYSEVWKRQLGYSGDEIADDFEEWRSRVHPDDLAPALARIEACVARGEGLYRSEFRLRHRDGSWRWILATGALLYDLGGRPTHLLGAHVDVTERRRAEAAVEASERSLRMLLDGLGRHIYVALLDRDGVLQQVNRPAREATRLRDDQLLGLRLPDAPLFAYDPAVRARVGDALAQAMAGATVRYDEQALMADGRPSWIDFTLQPLRGDDGEVRWLVASAVDIGQRKQAEAALHEHERRLSEAALRQRRLARRLAEVQEAEQRRISAELHDRIGQDLAALGLNLGLIASPRLDRAMIEARVHDSRQLLERASAVLRDLIAELRPVALDEYGLLAGLRALGEDVERRSGLRVSIHGVEPAPRLPEEVETALFRIAQEALTNAVKHAGASTVQLSLDAGGSGVRLRIADDGCGFDPALRAPGPRRHWGLEVMRDRAESVGARMVVDAAPGRGTCIVVAWEAEA